MRFPRSVVSLGFFLLWGSVSLSHARPELIRAGAPYYSNTYVQQGSIRDIEVEKNFEEVFQLYRFYKVIYDSLERVIVFKGYQQGKVVREERYGYTQDRVLNTHVILVPGEPAMIMPLGGGGTKSGVAGNQNKE